MAKKTNKTDHVLNLLSSGKKGSVKEDSDAPPVDLRRKAPEPPEEDIPKPREEELPEPRISAEPEDLPEDLPEPRVSAVVEEESLPEPKIHMEPVSMPEPKVTIEMAPKSPGVSVVHTGGEENHIAEAVKNSLEAEFNEYLRENGEIPEIPEEERFIEWDVSKPKERTEINVFELMRESEEEAAEPEIQETVLEKEPVAEPEPATEPEPVTEPEPAEEPEPVAESEPATEPEEPEEPELPEAVIEVEDQETLETVLVPEEPELLENVSVPEEPKVVSEPEPNAELAQEGKEVEPPIQEEKDYTMVNVMEYLVRDQAPRYIRQFGHCDCDRCIEDTVALTLTHLPAKYVVVNKNAVSPLLNFYEKRYAGQLIVEITKATMIVNESPNH